MVTRPSEDLEAFYNEFMTAVKEKWDSICIRVMVFGPDMTSDHPAAQLRRFIMDQCAEYRTTLVKSEHEKLVEIHREIAGPTHNLCDAEYHAAERVDGIIILPSSPGSLVELGMFALDPDVQAKTCVLFSHEYAPTIDSSFIGLGPKLTYRIGGATVDVVDYTMKELAWTKIREFLSILKQRKLWRNKDK